MPPVKDRRAISRKTESFEIYRSVRVECDIVMKNDMNAPRIKKEAYLVEGMTCSGCERTVQKVVGNLEGVITAKADLNAATVSVEYDPEKVTIDKIRAAVNGVGYRLTGERPALGQREGRDDAVS
jgi:copper chaperone CopZ